MESANKVPESFNLVNSSSISECFKNIKTRNLNFNVNDPKSIYGKAAKILTKKKDSTLDERRYLHLFCQNSKVLVLFRNKLN